MSESGNKRKRKRNEFEDDQSNYSNYSNKTQTKSAQTIKKVRLNTNTANNSPAKDSIGFSKLQLATDMEQSLQESELV